MRVVVELIAGRVAADELRYLVRRAECPRRADPQATARAELAVTFPQLWLHAILIHSTSWRYEEGSVVLTHVALLEELPLDALPLVLPLDQVDRPELDGVASVAAHALRHLAFLVREDPRKFRECLRPETLRRLERLAPAIAGRIDARAA